MVAAVPAGLVLLVGCGGMGFVGFDQQQHRVISSWLVSFWLPLQWQAAR